MSDCPDTPSDTYDSDGSVLDDAQDDSDYEIPNTQQRNKQKTGLIEHRALSPQELQETINDSIHRVSNLTGLEPSIASILLQYHKWDEERLLDKFMESPASVLNAIGEPDPQASPRTDARRPNKRPRLDTPTEFICGICCDTPSLDDIFKLRCDHAFCTACWEIYITSKIKDEGQCLFKCMQDECQTTVDEPTIARLAEHSTYGRYKELLLQSYVTASKDLRFCPHPSCTGIVSCHGGRGSSLLTEVPVVQCGDSHAFCFGCEHDSDHRPLICKFVAQWLKNAREDAGTSQWLKANTRQCPNCHNNIEKNGGCNRIHCRHCNFQFCWLCMNRWDKHGYNNAVCNVWKQPDPDDEKVTAQQTLEKWLFYFDRFNNHEVSAKLDQELCERTAEKMIDVQKTSQLSWIEAKFMQNAVEELARCRITLKWSYAMAFFLAQGNQKQIFEDIQADLEKAVEDLSQMLEEPVESESVHDLRQRMLNKTVYVRGRHEVLLQDTAAGLAEGRWEWVQSLD